MSLNIYLYKSLSQFRKVILLPVILFFLIPEASAQVTDTLIQKTTNSQIDTTLLKSNDSSNTKTALIKAIPELEKTTDTTTPKLKPQWVTPKKTALFSAVVPGLGQIHNKQYWKLPIVYGGLAVGAYFIIDNLNNYNNFRKVYAGRVGGDPNAFLQYPEYSTNIIKNARDFHRRNLDMAVFITTLGYGLQIIDALVFAQLKGFDISQDISFRPRPVSTPQGGLGLGLVMSF